MTGNLDIFVKVHSNERLSGEEEKISLDVEAVVITGSHTVSGQPVTLSMNGKSHRLATMEGGRLRAELIFPARPGKVQRLQAEVEGPHAVSTSCSMDVIVPGGEPESSDNSVTRFREDVLSGKRPIERGETLTLNKGFYDISNDIIVARGGKLVIEPGCTLEFVEGTGIRCEGIIEAVGSKEETITFTASRSHWSNILIYGRHTDGSRMAHCLVEHGAGRALETGSRREVLLPVNLEESNGKQHGGGLQILYTHRAHLTFEHLLVRENSASNGKGGGIYIAESAPVLSHSKVLQNEAADAGGGLYIEGADCEESRLTSLDIYNNKSREDGGGIYLHGVSPLLNECNISFNEARFGGGLYHSELPPDDLRLTNCNFHNNISLGTPDDTEGVSGAWKE